jgi:hypothetical protein
VAVKLTMARFPPAAIVRGIVSKSNVFTRPSRLVALAACAFVLFVIGGETGVRFSAMVGPATDVSSSPSSMPTNGDSAVPTTDEEDSTDTEEEDVCPAPGAACAADADCACQGFFANAAQEMFCNLPDDPSLTDPSSDPGVAGSSGDGIVVSFLNWLLPKSWELTAQLPEGGGFCEAEVECELAKAGEGCTDNDDCCSSSCNNGSCSLNYCVYGPPASYGDSIGPMTCTNQPICPSYNVLSQGSVNYRDADFQDRVNHWSDMTGAQGVCTDWYEGSQTCAKYPINAAKAEKGCTVLTDHAEHPYQVKAMAEGEGNEVNYVFYLYQDDFPLGRVADYCVVKLNPKNSEDYCTKLSITAKGYWQCDSWQYGCREKVEHHDFGGTVVGAVDYISIDGIAAPYLGAGDLDAQGKVITEPYNEFKSGYLVPGRNPAGYDDANCTPPPDSGFRTCGAGGAVNLVIPSEQQQGNIDMYSGFPTGITGGTPGTPIEYSYRSRPTNPDYGLSGCAYYQQQLERFQGTTYQYSINFFTSLIEQYCTPDPDADNSDSTTYSFTACEGYALAAAYATDSAVRDYYNSLYAAECTGTSGTTKSEGTASAASGSSASGTGSSLSSAGGTSSSAGSVSSMVSTGSDGSTGSTGSDGSFVSSPSTSSSAASLYIIGGSSTSASATSGTSVATSASSKAGSVTSGIQASVPNGSAGSTVSIASTASQPLSSGMSAVQLSSAANNFPYVYIPLDPRYNVIPSPSPFTPLREQPLEHRRGV